MPANVDVYVSRKDYERALAVRAQAAKAQAECAPGFVANANQRYGMLNLAATNYSSAADLAAQLNHKTLARSYARAANTLYRSMLQLGASGQVFEFHIHENLAGDIKANILVNDDIIERFSR